MPIARKGKDVKLDNAAIKAFFPMYMVEYNLVPELIYMCCDVLLKLDCIWSLHNPKNFEVTEC